MGEPIDDDLNTAPGGFLKFSDDGIILGLNDTLATLLGYAKDELTGTNVHHILNLAARIFFQTHLSPLLLVKGRADEIFLHLKSKDGQSLPVIVNAARKMQSGGPVNHCIVISAVQRGKYEEQLLEARRRAEDVALQNAELNASKKELEEQAYLLDRRLSELRTITDGLIHFGKLLSHDVQEPIRKIAIYADRLLTKYEKIPGTDVATQFDIIQQQCRRLRMLTQSLEQYISMHVHPEQQEQVDLAKCLAIALQTAAQAEGISEFEFSTTNLPQIFGYRNEIELLFYHLLKNSFRYRDPDRPLIIRIEHTLYNRNAYQVLEGRHRYTENVRLVLQDNGRGFDSSEAASWFKIERKDNTPNRLLSFGLAFCKKVVDNHFGTITLDSRPGVGTTVTVTFPLKS